MARAERPVVVAANAARYAANTEELQGFVEATGLPIFTVEQARGMVPDGHPLCFGYADAALNHAARHFREADAVLLLGKRLDHRYRYGMSPYFHDEAKIIQIDPDPHELGRNRGVAMGILGHIGAAVGQLTEAARGIRLGRTCRRGPQGSPQAGRRNCGPWRGWRQRMRPYIP